MFYRVYFIRWRNKMTLTTKSVSMEFFTQCEYYLISHVNTATRKKMKIFIILQCKSILESLLKISLNLFSYRFRKSLFIYGYSVISSYKRNTCIQCFNDTCQLSQKRTSSQVRQVHDSKRQHHYYCNKTHPKLSSTRHRGLVVTWTRQTISGSDIEDSSLDGFVNTSMWYLSSVFVWCLLTILEWWLELTDLNRSCDKIFFACFIKDRAAIVTSSVSSCGSFFRLLFNDRLCGNRLVFWFIIDLCSSVFIIDRIAISCFIIDHVAISFPVLLFSSYNSVFLKVFY